jgi:hypothetical protein
VTPDDYARAARAMIAAAERGQSATSILTRQCPNIARQIRQAGKCPKLLSLWGRSVNFDEYAQQEIVHPAILRAIGELASVPLRGRIVHSGLQHTYGYLFSLIETPFGFKRERWLNSALDDGFGFKKPTLRAEPASGTLLGNLTCFLSRLALCENRSGVEETHIANVVKDYAFDRLQRTRITEEVALPRNASESPGRITLCTDLVKAPFAPDEILLIYSARSSARSRTKLLTAFPADPPLLDELIRRTGKRVPVRLRFNGYVARFPQTPVVGKRSIINWHRS